MCEVRTERTSKKRVKPGVMRVALFTRTKKLKPTITELPCMEKVHTTMQFETIRTSIDDLVELARR